MKWLRLLASLKLTLFSMGLMVIAAIMVYGNPDAVSIWVLAGPMSIIALNLSAAIISNQKINKEPGLLLFHVCLLSAILLAGFGRLVYLDAHMELRRDQAFEPGNLLDVDAGPWHSGDIDKVKFVQGPFEVHYDPGVRRGLTFCWVKAWRNGQWVDQVIGDDRPLLFGDYRFYTTSNKGFSAIMTWQPLHGEAIVGALNMPSYPLFEYKQDNRWTPTGMGKEVRFWLRVNSGLDENAAWVLQPEKASARLVVNDGKQRVELKLGESVKLEGGTLRYDGLSSWMGYRVFYNPTIQWLFFVAIFGVAGLGHYFYRKLNLQVWSDESATDEALTGSKQ